MAVSTLWSLSGCTSTTPEVSAIQSIRARKQILAGVKYDSRPFGYMDADGSLKGFDIDLLRDLSRRMLGTPEAVSFNQVLSSTRVIALQSGGVDVVAATMTITPERRKLIDFSSPYYVAGQALVVPQRSSAHHLADLDGKRIIYVIGTTSEKNARGKLPKAEFIGFRSSTDAFSALRAGRGDAMTTDDAILAGFLASAPCEFRLLPERLSQEPYGLGFRKERGKSGEPTLREEVDRHLQAMRADGTLAKLREKWLAPLEKANRDCPGPGS